MKKICYVTYSIYNLGGIQRILTNLVNRLSNYYDITIICLTTIKDNRVDYGLNSNVKVIELNNSFIKNISLMPFKLIRKINRKLKLFKNDSIFFEIIEYYVPYMPLRKLKKQLLKTNYDYVISTGLDNNIILSGLEKKDNTKYYGWWHNNFECYVENNNHSKRFIEMSLKRLDNTFVLSQDDKNKIYDMFSVNTTVIYNASDLSKINRASLDNHNIIAVGRYTKQKRFDKLINIFEQFSKKEGNWNLFIVGEGEERKKLEKIIKEKNLKDKVYLTGQINNIEEYYYKSSIFVMTSEYEGFPMVLIEAMKFGLPVIVYDIPVFHEIIDNGSNGYIIEQDNITEFVNKLLYLTSNKKILREMGNNSLEIVKKFDINVIVNKWRKNLK